MRTSQPSSVTSSRSSSRTAAEARPVAARLDRHDVARDQLLVRAAEVRALVDLEPDPVPEAVVEALGRARCPAPWCARVGLPAASNGSQERPCSSRQTAPGRIAAITASSEARVSSQYSCSSAGGASPPATNVRVMSAQQRDALSRGQMSIRTTLAALDRARALLVAGRPTARRGRRSPSRAARRRARRRRAASPRAPARRSARAAARAAAPRPRAIAASAAAWARRMPASWASVLTRRRRSKASASTRSSMPLVAQPVGPGEREVGRHDRVLDADLAAGAQVALDLGLEEVDAGVEQLVQPELERVDGPRCPSPSASMRSRSSTPMTATLRSSSST